MIKVDLAEKAVERLLGDVEVAKLMLPIDYFSILDTYHKGDATNAEFMWYSNMHVDPRNEDLILGVKDYYVPTQHVTGMTCREEVDLDFLKYKTNCYIWGHSHVNMTVQPSGQDQIETKEQQELCFEALNKNEYTYFARVIMTKDYKMSADIFIICNVNGIMVSKNLKDLDIDIEVELDDREVEDVSVDPVITVNKQAPVTSQSAQPQSLPHAKSIVNNVQYGSSYIR